MAVLQKRIGLKDTSRYVAAGHGVKGHGPAVPERGGVSADPFTPEAVFALLRGTVLKDDATLPRSTDPTIAHLARVLNILRWKVQGWTGPWREEQEQRQRIATAISVLTEILPAERENYAATIGGFERWSMMDDAAEARADLAAFDALVTAARAARERGLPLALNTMIALSQSTERWKDFAEELQAIFHSALPSQGKAAAYRFIVAVTPAITGEHPSFEAVQTPLKKKRFVNRGKRVG
jgi:hypothetical protein